MKKFFILEIILPIIVSVFFTFIIFFNKIIFDENSFDKNALGVICTIIIIIVITSFTSFCSSSSKALLKISEENRVSYFIRTTLLTIGINIITVTFIIFNFSVKVQVLFFIYSISLFWNYTIIISSAFYYNLKNLSEEETKKQEMISDIKNKIIKIANDITIIKNREK